jgi:hypothetical protein
MRSRKIAAGFFVLAAILLMVTCGAQQEEKTEPVQDNKPAVTQGIIAYYPFNGNAEDAWNGNHGAVTGAIPINDRFGHENSAYIFNGTSDYISIPVNINPEKMPELTLVAWANAAESTPVRQVISHDDGDFDRSLGIDDRGGDLGWSAFAGSGGVLGFEPVVHDQWVFLAAVYDQTDSTVELYVNDQVHETKGFCGPGHDTTYIGMNPSFGEYFFGMIDDVIIYDRCLTKDEVLQLYNAGK